MDKLTRRGFHGATIAGAIGFGGASAGISSPQPPGYDVEVQTVTRHYDGKTCWCHPRAGIVPGKGRQGQPRVVMTMNSLDVSGSDVFKAMYTLETDDLGKSWTAPRMSETLAVRFELIGGRRRPVAVSDFWPQWHAGSNRLLGTGHTVVYTPDWKVRSPRPRHTAYAVYDPDRRSWLPWKKLQMPEQPEFVDCGAGCTQRVDRPDGSILLPLYFRPPGENSRVIVAHCEFNGSDLIYREHGSVLSVEDATRGLHEPSLAHVADRFFLTIRNDQRGYVTSSRDGLHFSPIRPWQFDNGAELGSYNTQQHWVTHGERLYLVYTRKGANNDHVFRHRAPLFMAEVDQDRLCVIRKTERVIVSERGARLGNFGITPVSSQETWVTVAEWMQTWGPNYVMPVKNKYGADGSVFVARLRWHRADS